MFERTRKALETLQNINWFTSVGEPIDESVLRAFSWENVVSHRLEEEYDDLQMEIRNEISLAAYFTVDSGKPESSRNWNKIMLEIKSLIDPVVRSKTKPYITKYDLSLWFETRVAWDMSHIAIAIEYSDVHTSSFYEQLHKWYLAGHFPCGWKGKYPSGSLIVF
ncbi:MAG: hypothetical protein AAFU54_14635 [Chloroflexota bacterium]